MYVLYANSATHKHNIHSNVHFQALRNLACKTSKETLTTTLFVGLGLQCKIQDNLESTWHTDRLVSTLTDQSESPCLSSQTSCYFSNKSR